MDSSPTDEIPNLSPQRTNSLSSDQSPTSPDHDVRRQTSNNGIGNITGGPKTGMQGGKMPTISINVMGNRGGISARNSSNSGSMDSGLPGVYSNQNGAGVPSNSGRDAYMHVSSNHSSSGMGSATPTSISSGPPSIAAGQSGSQPASLSSNGAANWPSYLSHDVPAVKQESVHSQSYQTRSSTGAVPVQMTPSRSLTPGQPTNESAQQRSSNIPTPLSSLTNPSGSTNSDASHYSGYRAERGDRTGHSPPSLPTTRSQTRAHLDSNRPMGDARSTGMDNSSNPQRVDPQRVDPQRVDPQRVDPQRADPRVGDNYRGDPQYRGKEGVPIAESPVDATFKNVDSKSKLKIKGSGATAFMAHASTVPVAAHINAAKDVAMTHIHNFLIEAKNRESVISEGACYAILEATGGRTDDPLLPKLMGLAGQQILERIANRAESLVNIQGDEEGSFLPVQTLLDSILAERPK